MDFSSKILKIMTLNVWRYYEWNKRKDKLILFIKEQKPDIVLMQEVAEDKRKAINQLEEINQGLYPYLIFKRQMKMKKWHNKLIDWNMYYGLGILSKFKITHAEFYKLPNVKKEKVSGFLHTKINFNDFILDVINVHFENTDEGAKQHLKLVLDYCTENNIKPIIAGDFNLPDYEFIYNLAKDYEISHKIKPYFSFYPTEFSHNEKPIVLDYIIAHKERFKITDVSCYEINISDHKPIIVSVIVK